MKRNFVLAFLIFIISTVVLANISIPQSTRYSNVINLEDKSFYIYFEKPVKSDYSKINVFLLEDNPKKIETMRIEVEFNKVVTLESSDKMLYSTRLIPREKNEYYSDFRLIYDGLWSFKMTVYEKDGIKTFKDYFYYSNLE